jgi:hypothetical protein
MALCVHIGQVNQKKAKRVLCFIERTHGDSHSLTIHPFVREQVGFTVFLKKKRRGQHLFVRCQPFGVDRHRKITS